MPLGFKPHAAGITQGLQTGLFFIQLLLSRNYLVEIMLKKLLYEGAW